MLRPDHGTVPLTLTLCVPEHSPHGLPRLAGSDGCDSARVSRSDSAPSSTTPERITPVITTSTREQRVRRAAKRDGLRLTKSRRPDLPLYALIDPDGKWLVADYESLDEVEASFTGS